MSIKRSRKQALMCIALGYAGELVAQVVNTYAAFDELPPEEKAFIDDYIRSIGERMIAQAEQRAVTAAEKASAKRIRGRL